MKKIIIAHRGASFYYYPNTMEAYIGAVRMKADMIEIDIRRTMDNVYVCHHDPDINGVFLKDVTYRDSLSLSSKEGYRIPILKDVLILAKNNRIKLDIELKEGGYEKDIVKLVLNYIKEDDFVITSFNDCTIKKTKKKYPKIRCGLLLGRAPWELKQMNKPVLLARLSELFPIKRAKNCYADFLAPHYKLLKLGFLNRAYKNNYNVFVWTVNDEALMKKFISNDKITGIISDKPDKAIAFKKQA